MASGLVTNKKTTGRAVADIKGLYFYNHTNGEPTIGQSILADSQWYGVLTSRGTVNASQNAPSITAIHVDQFDPAIGITSEPGDFTFEAFLPSMDALDIAKWVSPDLANVIETGANTELTGDGWEKRYGYGYNLDGKLYDRTVLIQTRTGDIFIFARAQVSFSFGQEDKTFGFRINGQVLAPSVSANKMFYALTNLGDAPSSSSAA